MFETPVLPPDHPLTPFAVVMLSAVRLLLGVMLLFLVALVALSLVLVWDRWQQRKRDARERTERQEREGEFYHTVRNTLAPLVGQLQLLQVLTEQKTRELKEDVKKTPVETATKVLDGLTHISDSGIHKPGGQS